MDNNGPNTNTTFNCSNNTNIQMSKDNHAPKTNITSNCSNETNSQNYQGNMDIFG